MLPAGTLVSASLQRRRVAAFDFDGTLSGGTIGARFCRELLGHRAYGWMLIRHFWPALSYALRIRHERSLERMTRHVFQGRLASDVRRAAQAFSEREVPRALLPAGMERLQEHLARGDRCVIVSRAYEWCIEPWARQLGISEIIGTRLEEGADGRLTGRMLEASCDGEQKRLRLLRWLGDRREWELHAYGDGPGDYAMLAAADQGYLLQGGSFVRWRH